MKIIITAKGFELTEALQSFVEEKFLSLEKFISFSEAEPEVFVTIEKETKHHNKGDIFTAEALINVPGKKIVSKETADDMSKAIVAAKDELKLEIEKHKEKTVDTRRREQRKSKQDLEK